MDRNDTGFKEKGETGSVWFEWLKIGHGRNRLPLGALCRYVWSGWPAKIDATRCNLKGERVGKDSVELRDEETLVFLGAFTPDRREGVTRVTANGYGVFQSARGLVKVAFSEVEAHRDAWR